MSRKKPIDRDREAEADEMLLRALRQLADEALEEEIPDRLLRTLREAKDRQASPGAKRADGAAAALPQPGRRRAGSG